MIDGRPTTDSGDTWLPAIPVVQAPMAGGPSTPALAAAVSNAGGLGFLAAGYLSAERLDADIAATVAQTARPFGVNLFVPAASVAESSALSSYAELLSAAANPHNAQVGVPHPDDDDWARKLDVVLHRRPGLVSFTFGVPDADVLRRLGSRGIQTAITVTTADEAALAEAAGADALIVQGPDAGGHRGTFDPAAAWSSVPLHDVIAAVRERTALPIVASGGISSAESVRSALAAGAVAAQLGTAFLLADEAGTSATHRAALTSGEFTETRVTHAFSGRRARGLLNDFMRRFDDVAPLGYPEVHQITSPLRRAAAGDPNGTNLWAGAGFASTRQGSAASILELMSREIPQSGLPGRREADSEATG